MSSKRRFWWDDHVSESQIDGFFQDVFAKGLNSKEFTLSLDQEAVAFDSEISWEQTLPRCRFGNATSFVLYSMGRYESRRVLDRMAKHDDSSKIHKLVFIHWDRGYASLNGFSNLVSLTLKGCSVGFGMVVQEELEEVRKWNEFLKNTTSLDHLVLDHVRMNAYIFSGIEENSTLKTLEICSDHQENEFEVFLLGRAVGKHRKLESVKIHPRWWYTQRHWEKFVPRLLDSKTIRKLSIKVPRLFFVMRLLPDLHRIRDFECVASKSLSPEGEPRLTYEFLEWLSRLDSFRFEAKECGDQLFRAVVAHKSSLWSSCKALLRRAAVENAYSGVTKLELNESTNLVKGMWRSFPRLEFLMVRLGSQADLDDLVNCLSSPLRGLEVDGAYECALSLLKSGVNSKWRLLEDFKINSLGESSLCVSHCFEELRSLLENNRNLHSLSLGRGVRLEGKQAEEMVGGVRRTAKLKKLAIEGLCVDAVVNALMSSIPFSSLELVSLRFPSRLRRIPETLKRVRSDSIEAVGLEKWRWPCGISRDEDVFGFASLDSCSYDLNPESEFNQRRFAKLSFFGLLLGCARRPPDGFLDALGDGPGKDGNDQLKMEIFSFLLELDKVR